MSLRDADFHGTIYLSFFFLAKYVRGLIIKDLTTSESEVLAEHYKDWKPKCFKCLFDLEVTVNY